MLCASGTVLVGQTIAGAITGSVHLLRNPSNRDDDLCLLKDSNWRLHRRSSAALIKLAEGPDGQPHGAGEMIASAVTEARFPKDHNSRLLGHDIRAFFDVGTVV